VAVSVSSRGLLPNRKTGKLLLKWLPVVLVPIAVFTFMWSGEAIVNQSLLGILDPQNPDLTHNLWFNSLDFLFILLLYSTTIVLQGYLVASDSGRRSAIEVWLDTLFTMVIPIILLDLTANLLIGLGLGVLIWAVYNLVRNRVRIALHHTPPAPLENVQAMDVEQQTSMVHLARLSGFWYATVFAVITLVVDLIYYAIGSLPTILLPWVIIRTVLLIGAGFFLGGLGGKIALRYVVKPTDEITVAEVGTSDNATKQRAGWRGKKISRQQQLQNLSASRAREEARDVVPNDKPLQSKGATRLYMFLFLAFILVYPILDPLLFGQGSNGRITSYGDLGFYVILALGLNIVVGFAGLLDLGYVAFFVIGTYAWSMVGSPQLYKLTGILLNQQLLSWFFWPMIIIAAVITALWGVLLGAPTLRLRGDYLAIVTLGFGEIIPIVFTQMDKYTNGSNGIAGVYPPATPCIGSFCLDWFSSKTPYFYLILILIGISIFANVRLRDSKLGRAWVAIREDEIAAASSGINLVNTKLFAFAAGAFFAGIAGVYHAAKLGAVAPADFNTNDSYIYLSMVVIGGLGSIPGVLVGAVVVYAINLLILNQLDTYALDPHNFLHIIPQIIPNFSFENIRNLLFGSILIIIMIFRPEGLIPSARRQRELHKPKNEHEDSEESLGSLDEPPGSAAFGTEVHVE
jgi:ABC-type branched-subunit amino acid transport system permease subunit